MARRKLTTTNAAVDGVLSPILSNPLSFIGSLAGAVIGGGAGAAVGSTLGKVGDQLVFELVPDNPAMVESGEEVDDE